MKMAQFLWEMVIYILKLNHNGLQQESLYLLKCSQQYMYMVKIALSWRVTGHSSTLFTITLTS